ncbi:GIY-YIG nuclease family protein [Pedobacter aquatilis]|uniref:GIY-YIG nuclease family protein n=1 Tax=Pedobacter aquatilis TaxID=351343 RepID=UPI00292F97BC|nr:GIY-YIG nuclease family protein [Pedobacter aquatilis]
MKYYHVYILRCNDGSYYTGVTNDIERRFQEHVNGENKTCYTFNKRPLSLVFCDHFIDINQAIAFEKQIKGWGRKKKEAIISNNWEKLKELAICKNDTTHLNFKKLSFDSAQDDSFDSAQDDSFDSARDDNFDYA